MGHLPLIFLEWRDLPPGRSIPQAFARQRRRCRGLVMGRRRGQVLRDGGGTKLQHLAAIRGGRIRMAVTGLTIHDIVISPRFPSPIFSSKAFRFQHKHCSSAGPMDQNCLISEGARDDFDLE
jgi:hypothetical protein